MAHQQPIATNPLATARQLWALNRAGRLALRIGDTQISMRTPLSAQDADQALKALRQDTAEPAR